MLNADSLQDIEKLLEMLTLLTEKIEKFSNSNDVINKKQLKMIDQLKTEVFQLTRTFESSQKILKKLNSNHKENIELSSKHILELEGIKRNAKEVAAKYKGYCFKKVDSLK